MILTEQQELVRETAERFARERLEPNTRAWEAGGAVPDEVIRELGELGFLGALTPGEFGGAELDYVSYALALMEIAGGDPGLSTIVSVNNAPVSAILLRYGSDEQKARFLPPITSGEGVGAFALTEPHAGSDAAALRMVARRQGNRYVLSGTKQFVTSGSSGLFTIVFARTAQDAGKRGISAFIVPRATPGLRVARIEHKMGQASSDTCQLVFEDAGIDADLRIGAEGEGYRIALSSLEAGRIGIAAQSVGMAAAALRHAQAYCRDRTAFGQPLTAHQAVAFRLADMATKVEAARQLVLHAASLRDAGRPGLAEACMAKLFASEIAEQVCSAAIQCLGGYGYVTDFLLEKLYRDVRVCQIYEGTSDVQRIIISRGLDAR